MRKVITLLFFISLSVISTAQNNLPPVYEITTDTSVVDTLPNTYWQMLEDKNGKLSFEEVSKPPLADRFHYNTTKTRRIDYSISTYWMRYRFRNDLTHEVKIAIPANAT
jgi:hypothetical protein